MKNKALWVIVIIFCFIFCALNYTNKNFDKILASRAEYYFKHNDIAKAQEYFEKAFKLGLQDSKQRDIYINTIINSPLTVEAQEKLILFLNNPKEDVARVKAEYFLYDIKREIHRKYPNNYITNAVFNQKIMRWGKLPITYSFTNKEDAPIYFVREIEAALTEWERATNHQLMFVEDDNKPNILINFETHNPADTEDKKYVVAYTVPSISHDILKNMEINFYLTNPYNKNFSANQVYNTALHEIAHAIGFMGHCNDKDNIMYLTKDSMSIINNLRENLSEADINTIKLLYKIKPQITNEDIIKSDYIPHLVLGNEKEVNNEKIKEAKIYIKNAPNLPSGYIDLAEGYVAAKDYGKAIKSLEKALRLSDTEEIKSMVLYNLAVTNFYLDKLEKSKNYLIQSMQINDSNDKHYLLGEIYIREGNSTKAIEEYSSLIKKDPKNIEYTIALVNIHVLNRDFFKARKALKNYFQIVPSNKNNSRFAPYGILLLGL